MEEKNIKNIPRPVGSYKVLMEPRITVTGENEKLRAMPIWRRKTVLAAVGGLSLLALAAGMWVRYPSSPRLEKMTPVEEMTYRSDDQPALAVLPFANMSEDPEQAYFSDGITEDIITGLSALPKLSVISRNSTFVHKGKSVDVKQVGLELGARYILEGSVQKADDRVRITAQLIDAATGHHIWAERCDREFKDIFVLQDEIVLQIMRALQLTLSEGQRHSIKGKAPEDLDAYLKLLKGRSYFMRPKTEYHGFTRG